MERYVCKVCGEQLEQRIGDYYVCKYCGSRWKVEEEVTRLPVLENAWQTLRNGDFDVAEELFEDVINTDNANHEAYWGRALASASIIYVNDLNENKKVPTCNNISEQVFADGTFVKKAIELAPAEIADSYKQQAEYIDKVRIEWLNKASKEPAYDVFISYKDSDKEHGIERTQDSYDAQELYTELVRRGYNVFYSRVSLRDKLSEQYEPYIYNAIKTAKVMIVLAEKPEYITATWVKNEWSRFRNRIESGEKDSRSLVFVYKNLDLSDIPAALRSRQCLNMAEMIFLPSLISHIEKVIESSRKNQGVEKIAITGGKIAKKSTEISQNQITVREMGSTVAQTSLNDAQTLSLVRTYLAAQSFDQALALTNALLAKSPRNGEVKAVKMLAEQHFASESELIAKIKFDKQICREFEDIIECAAKDYAEQLIAQLYIGACERSDSEMYNILEFVLPFNCSERESLIAKTADNCIAKDKYCSFKLLLSTLDGKQVDRYIELLLNYANVNVRSNNLDACIDAVLEVDEGNVEAYQYRLYRLLSSNGSVDDLKSVSEKIIRYSADSDAKVVELLDKLTTRIKMSFSVVDGELARYVVRFYQKDIADLDSVLLNIADVLLSNSDFGNAEYFYGIVLSHNDMNAQACLGVSLAKVGVNSLLEVSSESEELLLLPEFNRYLVLETDEKRLKVINSLNKQVEKAHQERAAYAEAERHLAEGREERKKQRDEVLARMEKSRKGEKRTARKTVLFFAILCCVIAVLSVFNCWAWWSIVLVVLIGVVLTLVLITYVPWMFYLILAAYIALFSVFGLWTWWDIILTVLVGGFLLLYAIGMQVDSDYADIKSFDSKVEARKCQNKAWHEGLLLNNVGEVEEEAFLGCGALSGVTIKKELKYIGVGAFRDCVSVKKVNYVDFELEDLLTIKFSDEFSNPLVYGADLYLNGNLVTELTVNHYQNEFVLCGCGSLECVTVACESINDMVFAICEKLSTVTLSSKLQKIGDKAFYGCGALTEIRFDGTVKQWLRVQKGTCWNVGTGDYKVCCIDGTLDKWGKRVK